MSIFTKIFIVLVMVLSVLLAALIVPFVVNRDTFKAKWLDVQSQLAIAKHNAKNREADLNEMIQTKNSEIDNLNTRISGLQQQINAKDIDYQKLQADVITLQNNNADVRGQLARLSTALDQASRINDMLQAEIKDRRTKMLNLQTRNVELSDALRDRTTQVDTLVRQVRMLKEDIADLNNRNEQLQEQVASQPAPQVVQVGGPMENLKVGYESRYVIRGLVTDVETASGETFIAMNVGSNDHVREGMRFMIHQGDQFLGNAIVTKVDLNSSAGRVLLQKGEITPNVEVLAGGLP